MRGSRGLTGNRGLDLCIDDSKCLAPSSMLSAAAACLWALGVAFCTGSQQA